MKTLAALLVVLVPVSAAAAAASDLRPATGAEAEAQTFDRTVRCSTAFIGGARSLTAFAHQGTGRTGARGTGPLSHG